MSFFKRKNAIRSANKEVIWQLRRVTNSNSADPRSLFLWVCPQVPDTGRISGSASSSHNVWRRLLGSELEGSCKVAVQASFGAGLQSRH